MARKKLALAEETSCLETSDIDEEARPARRRKATILTDEPESDCDALRATVPSLPRPHVPPDLNWSCASTSVTG